MRRNKSEVVARRGRKYAVGVVTKAVERFFAEQFSEFWIFRVKRICDWMHCNQPCALCEMQPVFDGMSAVSPTAPSETQIEMMNVPAEILVPARRSFTTSNKEGVNGGVI